MAKFKVIFTDMTMHYAIVEAETEQEAIDKASGNVENFEPNFIEFGDPDWQFERAVKMKEGD